MEYSESVKTADNTALNIDLISTILKSDKLDTETRSEYEQILKELTRISGNLENISEDPWLYVESGAVDRKSILDLGAKSSAIGSLKLLMDTLFSISHIDTSTPEWAFLYSTLAKMLLLNLAWTIIVGAIYFFWIRRVFFPIQTVTENLSRIIHKGEYTTIPYGATDEFTALVTMINNLNKSLSIQEKIRSDFLSDFSHEVRTPITAVKCYIEWIEDGVIKMDSATVSLLKNELDRLSDITEWVMNYEKLTYTHEEKIKVERFYPYKTIEHVIAEYSPQLTLTNQKITHTISPGFTLTMDKTMFSQILHNIVSNFIKYAGNNTTLSISGEKTKEYTYLTFRDNGVGVPKEEIPYLKERFYRLDKARTQTKAVSMGIGLSIVEKIARLHSGECVLDIPPEWGFRIRIGIRR